MKVLVNGGTGFVGSAIVRALLAHPEQPDVRVLSRSPEKYRGYFPDSVQLVQGDVLRPHTLPTAFAGVQAVVNAVQFPGYPVEAPKRGLTFDRYDRVGTEEQIRIAREAGVPRFVYVSGVGADATSTKPWYRAKGLAEAALQRSGLSWTIIRPSWAYGPDDNSLNRFVTIARRTPVVMPVVGDGTQQLMPVHIEDVAAVVAQAALQSPQGPLDEQIIEVGGPDTVNMDEVVGLMLKAMGLQRRLVHVPEVLPRLGGSVLAAVMPRPPLNAEAVDFLVADALADTSKLYALTDITPRTLEEGLTYLRPS